MALSTASILFKGVVGEPVIPQEVATVYCDNLRAICLAKDHVHHNRTKHIDVRYHFLHTNKRVKVKKIGTAPANFFTKHVPLSLNIA